MTANFLAGTRVRIKDDVTLDEGRHNGKTGVILERAGRYFHYVTLDDGSYTGLPVRLDEIELVPTEPTVAALLTAKREEYSANVAKTADLDRDRDRLSREITALETTLELLSS